MAAPTKAVAYIEMEDFLAMENASKYKHEYLQGVIYAVQGEPVRGMAGGRQTHSRIIRNAGYAPHGKLQGSPCEALSTEMRLRVAAADAVFYPDVLVHCRQIGNPATTMELTEARLVIEVLSPTTQHFDRAASCGRTSGLPACGTSSCSPAWKKLPGLATGSLVQRGMTLEPRA